MKVGESAGSEETTAYAYRTSALGAPRTFKLASDGLDWAAGAASGHIPYRQIRRIRMSYRPVSMQSHHFLTELWADGAKKLQISSCSWKSMFEQERQDQAYSDFVTGLHHRVAATGSPARCERGRPPLLYWPGLVAFAGASFGMMALIARALQTDTKGGAAFIAVFLLLFLWWGQNFFRRNVPGFYRPESPPIALMPK